MGFLYRSKRSILFEGCRFPAAFAFRRNVLFILRFTLLLFLAFSASIAMAEAAPQNWTFRDWSVSCPQAAESCIAATTTLAADRTWLATLRLQPENNGGARLQVLLPQQIHIGSGVFARLSGGSEQRLRLIRCVPGTCEARIDLPGAELTAWKSARVVQLTYRPAPNAPPIHFDVSLMGLTNALAQARAEEAPK
ncbi:invasion associated locus B family protein [Thioclava sp.]|uniref:invasion associated locus B family protein n=1 Tax=Thioclava sp. TaxID=1933450 RepID=UPI003AA865A0